MNACIIVPYRNRAEHLSRFIPALSNYLRLKGINFEIVIIEQAPGKPFNRGKLLNIGFDLCSSRFDYFILHDVDMLPVNADYSYCKTPTHIATQCSQYEHTMPYADYFGGVTLFNRSDFASINGFNNSFWGWGAEDDDLRHRVLAKGLHIERRKCSFKSLAHGRTLIHKDYDANVKLLAKGADFNDGLSSLTYKIIDANPVQGCVKYTCEI